MDNSEAVWREMLSKLEVEVNALSFDVFIKPLQPLKVEDDILVLCAPTSELRDEVTMRYMHYLKRALRKTEDAPAELIVISEDEAPQKLADAAEKAEKFESAGEGYSALNPKYNFTSFVVGSCNNLAYESAMHVAEHPGEDMNPLFIYGDVGLGKTHIMQAIGNDMRMEKPNAKMLYVSTDTFINEFIASIRANKGANNKSFRDKYRNLDLLMIDDVQFLSGKPSTQDELFNIFETLKNAGKQMVFACDRRPTDIPDLDNRIKSRFSSSMIVDVQPPSLETRIAILQQKAKEARTNIDMKELTFIAERVTSNIREMEGVLTKVCFLSKLYGRKVDLAMCQETLKDYLASEVDEITVDRIVDCACRYFGVQKSDIVGKKKNKEIVVPRMYAIYVINELMSIPLAAIGEYFGGREHTTVMHARDKIAAMLQTDAGARTAVSDIKAMVLRK